MDPNAYVQENPKEILKLMAEFCQLKEIRYFYNKNSYKFGMQIPMSENKLINFWIKFERGKKKSSKDLYRLRFLAEREDAQQSQEAADAENWDPINI